MWFMWQLRKLNFISLPKICTFKIVIQIRSQYYFNLLNYKHLQALPCSIFCLIVSMKVHCHLFCVCLLSMNIFTCICLETTPKFNTNLIIAFVEVLFQIMHKMPDDYKNIKIVHTESKNHSHPHINKIMMN